MHRDRLACSLPFALAISLLIAVSTAGCDVFSAFGADAGADDSPDGSSGSSVDLGNDPSDPGPGDDWTDGTSAPSPTRDQPDPGWSRASVFVTASVGGELSVGGATLTIPAGSASVDTEVRIETPETLLYGGAGTLAAARGFPDGLTFDPPATLVLPFEPGLTDDALEVRMFSRANPFPEVGGERRPWELVEGAVVDTVAGLVTIPVTHFSGWELMSFPDSFTAFDIPTKYLQKGDILYTLTGAGDFEGGGAWPVHVGVVIDHPSGDVIESTLSTSGCTTDSGVIVGPYDAGSAEQAKNPGFRDLCGQHYFLGARRPPGGASDEERDLAVAHAESKLGSPWGMIGFTVYPGLPWIGDGAAPPTFEGVSCVELAEDAWEAAGINLSYHPDELLNPLVQYAATSPVVRLTMDVDDGPLLLPVQVAIETESGSYTRELGKTLALTPTWFLDVQRDTGTFEGSATLEDSPSRQAVKQVRFQPAQGDVGKRVRLEVELDLPNHDPPLHDIGPVVIIEVTDEPEEIDWTLCEQERLIFTNDHGFVWYDGTATITGNGQTFTEDDYELTPRIDEETQLITFWLTDFWKASGVPSVGGVLRDLVSFADFAAGGAISFPLPLQRNPLSVDVYDPSLSITCYDGTDPYGGVPAEGLLTLDVSPDCDSVVVTVDATAYTLEDDGSTRTCSVQFSFTGTH